MQRRPRLRAASSIVFAAAAIGVSAGGATGQEQTDLDWPQFQGGSGHGGFLPEGAQPPYRVRWTLQPPEGEALSAAIVVGEQAISVGSQAVYGIDLSTGAVRWSIPRAGGALSVPAAASLAGRDVLAYLEGPMPVASPTVTPSPATPSVSPPSTEDDLGVERVSSLVVVDLADRSELWRMPLLAPSRSGLTIEGEVAYVGDQDGNVFAFALADGSMVWPEPAEVPGRVDTPVAVDGDVVYAVIRDLDEVRVSIVALDASSGERRWAVGIQTSSTAGSAPSVGAAGVIVGSADRVVRELGAADGEQVWSSLVLSLFSPSTSPAVAEDAVFVADVSGGLYRLEAADGERRWSYQFNEVVIRSAPVVSGSSVLLGLDDGRLVAVDVERGRLIWQSEPSPGALGAIAVSSDTIVAVRAGEQGGLVALEHDPSGSLIDEPSPTELVAGTTLGRYAMAAAIVFVLALVPGLVLAKRAGPAQLEPSADDEQPDPDGNEDEDEASDGGDDR
ncbi:MAG: PQQ-binding-like beta-propeller repeat protein [Actinomycetota bacterium]